MIQHGASSEIKIFDLESHCQGQIRQNQTKMVNIQGYRYLSTVLSIYKLANDNKDISGNAYVMLLKYYIKIFDLDKHPQCQTDHEVSKTYTFVGNVSA